jgi:hypothetical protein
MQIKFEMWDLELGVNDSVAAVLAKISSRSSTSFLLFPLLYAVLRLWQISCDGDWKSIVMWVIGIVAYELSGVRLESISCHLNAAFYTR